MKDIPTANDDSRTIRDIDAHCVDKTASIHRVLSYMVDNVFLFTRPRRPFREDAEPEHDRRPSQPEARGQHMVRGLEASGPRPDNPDENACHMST